MPVTSVTESQSIDAAGNLTDTFEITFTIPGTPGSFTVSVPQAGDPVAAAKAAIDAKQAEVGGILAL